MILAQAESVYWRLVLARDSVRVAKDTLERQLKLRDWNANRVKMQLADRSDYLQSEAVVEARRLELRGAEDEERAAARAFNSLRSLDSDEVPEKLQSLVGTELDRLSPPARAQFREDVLAAEQQARLQEASAEIGRERNKPQLDFYAALSTNGRDVVQGSAINESFTLQRQNNTVGLRFVAPLNFGATSDAREGYARERQAASTNLERRRFEQEREWQDLSRRFEDAKARLKLARTYESAQREKLNHERDRQRRGRTTTFQVLMFEQDYSMAQLAHLQAQAQLLQILTQMKTFSPSPSASSVSDAGSTPSTIGGAS
jgi:outer membrane protein TolC